MIHITDHHSNFNVALQMTGNFDYPVLQRPTIAFTCFYGKFKVVPVLEAPRHEHTCWSGG
jgi:hypothetical protein